MSTPQEQEKLRDDILAYTGQYVRENAVATLASPALRPALQARVLDDLTDCFHLGSAAKNSNAARRVREQGWLRLKRPMAAAGLAQSLGTFMIAAQRAALRRLGSPTVTADLRDAAGSAAEVAQTIDAISSGTDSANYIPTGITVLDYRLGGGLPLGKLTLCGAPTGGAKTTFAMQIAWDAAQQDRGLVLVVSPEMSAKDLWFRLALRSAGFSKADMKPGSANQETAVAAVTLAMAKQMERSNLILLDRGDADLASAMEAARTLHETRGPLYLLVLDYAQQLASGASEKKRYQEVGQVGSESLLLAEATGAAVFLTSQVNTIRSGKGGKEIDYTFRESAQMEQKASVAFVMEPKRSERKMRFILRKVRDGEAAGLTECRWAPELYKLSDLSDEESK